MKKLVYALLVLAYVTVAYLSVYVLPHYYSGAIIGAAGASLGASFKQFKEVKALLIKPYWLILRGMRKRQVVYYWSFWEYSFLLALCWNLIGNMA
ncbi:TPA: hypothetical protein ACIRK6_001012 [Streptococcus suis]